MKNMVKVFGLIAIVAIIGFSMAGCGTKDDEEFEATTTGRLAITGLSAYNGQEIYAESSSFTGSDGNFTLVAYERATNMYNPNENDSVPGNRYPGTVANGQAVLKVFVKKEEPGNGKSGGFQSYTGNDQNVEFYVSVGGNWVTVTVNFSNGIASGAFVAN